MIDEKIEELWTTTRKLMEEGTLEKHLPEQMEFFAAFWPSSEVAGGWGKFTPLPDLASRFCHG